MGVMDGNTWSNAFKWMGTAFLAIEQTSGQMVRVGMVQLVRVVSILEWFNWLFNLGSIGFKLVRDSTGIVVGKKNVFQDTPTPPTPVPIILFFFRSPPRFNDCPDFRLIAKF